MALLHLTGFYKISTIVSSSQDGDIIDRVLRWLGGFTVRGSSTRGGIGALKGLFTLLKDGRSASFTVDGPKGPIHVVKPGVFEVAGRMKIPIFWAGIAVSKKYIFKKSWNQAYLPMPFAKIKIVWNGPLWVDEKDPRDPLLASDLAEKLHSASQQVFFTA